MTTVVCEQLFDGRELRGRSRIDVEGGAITAVAPMDGDVVDDVIHVPFVMPGLVDAHVHITGYREGSPVGVPFEPEKSFSRLAISAGVTTVRDLGNSVEAISYIREWCEKFNGPRVFSSGPILDKPPLAWPFSRMARTDAEVRHAVAQLAGEGLQWIKGYRGVEPDICRAMVDAAAAHGLPVAIHCGRTTASQASDAGVRSLEHASHALPDVLDADTTEQLPVDGTAYAIRWADVDPHGPAASRFIERLRANGTWMCPTLLVSRRWAILEEMVNEPKLDYAAIVMPYHLQLKRMQNPVGMRIGKRYLARYMPVSILGRHERKQAQQGLQNMAALVVRMYREGIGVALGTDAPNPSLVPGFSLHDEMIELHRGGLNPVEVLSLATSAGGRLLRAPDIGVIRPGAQADLVCLQGDPARDLQDLATIERVMVRGKWVDLEAVQHKLEEAVRTND